MYIYINTDIIPYAVVKTRQQPFDIEPKDDINKKNNIKKGREKNKNPGENKSVDCDYSAVSPSQGNRYSSLIIFRLGALGALGFGSPLGM
jgi:hypothetical protein